MMGAYDELIKMKGDDFVEAKRKELISPRGSILNGRLISHMDLAEPRYGQNYRLISRKYTNSQTSAGYADVGFVFNESGTAQAIKDITVGNGIINLYANYADKLLFDSEGKAQRWAEEKNKRPYISRAVDALMRQTDIQYRVHGDRLHYFVLGKISFDARGKFGELEHMVFPLFLFSCQGDTKTIRKTLSMEVEQSGFINFPVDEKYLEGELSKCIGGVEVALDADITLKMTKLQKTIPKNNYLAVENVEIDPTFSMIGVITGFETEYLDKAWEEILNA